MAERCAGTCPRKSNRKQKKCQYTLAKETGIKCAPAPTQNIAICNAGLVNGLSEETVYENFIPYGLIETIAMIPGKSCCFLRYKTVDSAIEAFDNINGKLNIAQYNKPLYLSYVENIPAADPIPLNKTPPGLTVIEDFVDEVEEDILLNLCDFSTSEDGAMKYRQVKHFGYEFRYDINNVDKDKPLGKKIPAECNFLLKRLKARDIKLVPDQLTVNHYRPGQGIPPHIDTHSAFQDPILSLSLGSAAVMNFRYLNLNFPVVLPRRSLLIMSGESRYCWSHGMTPRKLDVIHGSRGSDLTVIQRDTRVSFTFRKIRDGECDCLYPHYCDSRQIKLDLAGNVTAEKLELEHVYDIYDNIAMHFSDTRCKPWPNVLEFLQSFPAGSILVDVGCGNGKYLGCVKNIYNLGCDRSSALSEMCEQSGYEVFSCNCMNIPMRDNVADGVISIAVIHHLATEARRLKSIEEMARILKVGGKCLLYVWAQDQCRNDEKTTYLKQDRKNRKKAGAVLAEQLPPNVSITDNLMLPVHTNRTQFQHRDVLVPWKTRSEEASSSSDGDIYLRFYHVFDEHELYDVISQFEHLKILRYYYDQGNWCCLFEKIKEKTSEN